MGGDLTVVDGAPGQGTTVRLSLVTAEEAATGSSPQVAADDERAAPELRGLRIPLADDNEDIRYAMTTLLTFYGAKVVEASDGAEAVALCERAAFDVILMDVRMPRLDGLEATRKLRQLGSRVPIIALTGDAVLEHRRECLAAGCSAYVAKPVDLEQLFAVINELRRAGVEPARR